MRGSKGGLVAILIATAMIVGACNDAQREWRVAADAKASADDIIDAGRPADVARGGGQTVVTWEVQPEDDEGPYQGAWRLYDKDGDAVADGRFKQVFEASGRIDVHPVRDGFLLNDYGTRTLLRLDRKGKLHAIPKGTNVATLLGHHVEDDMWEGEREQNWSLQLPNQKRLVRWGDLPTDQPQGMIAAGGELWVGMPRRQDYEPGRIAHSKTGRAPWIMETIPNPPKSAIDSESLTESAGSLFAVAINFDAGPNRDRLEVVSILRRPLVGKGTWEQIDATGIDDGPKATLTVAPRITQLPDGRLFATAGGEGAWLQKRGGGWAAVAVPAKAKQDGNMPPYVMADHRRLWALAAHSLHYSDDLGESWTEFDR